MQHFCRYMSPLGPMVLAADEGGLIGLWFEGQKHCASSLPVDATDRQSPLLLETIQWLELYFAGQQPDFLPQLHLQGTPFQLQVWSLLLEIPWGEVRTYGQIASRIAENSGRKRMSAQAVGNAIGHNPVSILVPCHRVIGADGSLTGYAGGLNRKRALLHLENPMRF